MTNKNLYAALSKAQSKIQGAVKDVTNPFFKAKYADLSSVWEACREALTSNGLAVIQSPEVRDGVIGVATKLVHETGEFEEGFLPLPLKAGAGAQDYGSAITYMRRYALAAMVGVAPEDDDGNDAQKSAPKSPPITPHVVSKEESSKVKIILNNIMSVASLDELTLYCDQVRDDIAKFAPEHKAELSKAKALMTEHFKELGQ